MKKLTVLFTLIVLLNGNLACQEKPDTLYTAFYNLENLFDTKNHPDKNDEDFTPAGVKEWTDERLEKKMYDLSRVIRSMNNERGPDLLGVCEVEHEYLLTDMINKFLSDKNYKTAYFESPDMRGIDNGLIYNSDVFTLISVKGDTVPLAGDFPTRLILNVALRTVHSDTINVFVNHWPSRRGGREETEAGRVLAASVLRKAVDRIFSVNGLAKVIIMGDFNDDPINKSITETLGAEPVICENAGDEFFEIDTQSKLFNLSFESYNKGEGSYKYQDQWNMLDQIIVSGELLTGNKLRYLCSSYEVYKPGFIVTQSGRFAGAPFPTYGGNRYLGGYSDHYPVIAKFIWNKKE